MTVLTLTAGTAFIMWLGEQITERGIGNGISLIIFAGIVARMPAAIMNTFRLMSTGEMNIFAIVILVAHDAGRRIHHFCGAGAAAHPGAVCQAGGRPAHVRWAEHASTAQNQYIGGYSADFCIIDHHVSGDHRQFHYDSLDEGHRRCDAAGKLFYELLYVGFIFFFCYFYTAVTFNPVDVADNMKKNGGYIPGIRPGKRTADYIDRVLTRITLGVPFMCRPYVCSLPF
jgi:preprotein translocase subunit SecY